MITLEARSLTELGELQAQHSKAMKSSASNDGLTPEKVAKLLKRLDAIEAKEGRLTLARILGQEEPKTSSPTTSEGTPEEHWLEFDWMPFTGHGRYSSDGNYHLAWGKVDDKDYRVAVSRNGQLSAWLQPSVRVVDGWISDSGIFAIKAHLSEDDVCFAFAESDGCIFHVWTRSWRFLTFTRLNTDGMGFAYSDDTGQHEVAFSC